MGIAVVLALASTLLGAAPARASYSWIKSKYPVQAAASEDGTASGRKWALLIGINDYAAPTVDNIGARQDAQGFQYTLQKMFGWRSDHIIVMLDRDATADHIIQGIRWLSYKARADSIVIFHYSGHENYTRTLADGDNETRDVEIWGADNHYILDGILGQEMNRIVAYHMWIDISTCRAAGFADAGMVKPGRILTYSSTVSEFSYEDPYSKHSVFTWWEVNLGIYGKRADANHDGKVTVNEAFTWAKPFVTAYTSGRQHPVVINKIVGYMYL